MCRPACPTCCWQATDLPDFGVLEAHLKETAQKVRSHFDLLLRAKRG